MNSNSYDKWTDLIDHRRNMMLPNSVEELLLLQSYTYFRLLLKYLKNLHVFFKSLKESLLL